MELSISPDAAKYFRKYFSKIQLKALLLFLFILSPALIVRVLLIAHFNDSISEIDVFGFISDFAISILVYVVAINVGIASLYIITLLWIVSCITIYHLTIVLGSQVFTNNFNYVFDSVFFFGSVATLSNFIVFVSISIILFVGLFFMRPSPLKSAFLWSTIFSVSSVLLLTVAYLASGSALARSAATWRTENFLVSNIREIFRSATSSVSPPLDLANPDPAAAAIFAADLAGTGRSMLRQRDNYPNIILLVLESVSGAYLPDYAASRGLTATPRMERLAKIARTGLSFSSFVTQQRQSNRGAFAIFCGTMPKLSSGTPMMIEYVNTGTRKCLPSVLGDAGYETAYVQSHSMEFMSYDRFMPKAGFVRVYDNTFFENAYARNQWGVDDKAFLEKSLEVITELDEGEKPWFLTLVTSGTHHPYLVPPDFADDKAKTDYELALDWLDLAVDAFVTSLREKGLLENTLLIITSDESAGIDQAPDDLTRDLSQNWGLLIAISDGIEPEEVGVPFVQSDIALSILDYAGLADNGLDFSGRSLFRKYDTQRPIYFANTYHQMVAELDAHGALTKCNESLSDCERFDGEGVLFGPPFGRKPIRAEPSKTLIQVQALSLGENQKGEMTDYMLHPPGAVTLSGEQAMIFGGQYFSMSSGQAAELDLEAEISGSSRGIANVVLKVTSSNDEVDYRPLIPLLTKDERLKMRVNIIPQNDVRRLEVNLYGSSSTPGDQQLVIRKAKLGIVAAGGRSPGLEVEQFDLSRSRLDSTRSFSIPLDWFRTASCVSLNGRELDAIDCAPSSLVYGPYVTVIPGDHVKASYDVLVRRGAATLKTDVVSDLAETKHQESEPVSMAAGEEHHFVVDFSPDEPIGRLETRLRLTSQDSAELAIDGATFEIERTSKVNSLRLAPCVTRDKTKLRVIGCPPTPLIFGPYVHVVAGDRVRASFDVTVERGSATLQADVVSAYGRVTHLKSDKVELTEGEHHRFELDFLPTESIDLVETRLHLLPGKVGNLTIENVTFEVLSR